MENCQICKRTIKDTEVYTGKNLQNEIVGLLRSVFDEGVLFVVYEKEFEEIAHKLSDRFKKGGYRVFTSETQDVFKEDNALLITKVPEYVRYVFAIGDAKSCVVAKAICKALATEWSCFLCSVSDDTVMCDIQPNQVFIDTNIIDKMPKQRIASAYGNLFSMPLRAFEREFCLKVLDVQRSEVIACETCEDNASLALKMLEISSCNDWDDSAMIMAKLLRERAIKSGKTPRLLGEYRLISSCLIASFYSNLLRSPSIDVLPPPSRYEDCADSDIVAQVNLKDGKCVDFFDINSYFRINYILGEYRMDLLERLANIDVHGMQRFWRRLYGDAGYWLKSEITAKEMIALLPLAGAQSDNLLGYAYTSGILKKNA